MSGPSDWTQPDRRSEQPGWQQPGPGGWSRDGSQPGGAGQPDPWRGEAVPPPWSPQQQYQQPNVGPPAGYGQPGYGQPGPSPHPGYQVSPYAQAPYGQPVVAPKSPGISLLASFFVPGLGTMINGEVGKGVGILVGYVVSLLLAWLLLPILVMLGLWVWGMADAYQGAQRWNARHGIVS